MKRIKKVGVLSIGKFIASLYAVLGFIGGVFFSLVAVFSTGEHAAPTIFKFAFILFPVLYGIIGFIAGLILSVVYNLTAKMVGGIEVEVE